VHLDTATVAQVSKPAVSPTSKSATPREPSGRRVWKPAIQQVWKPALRYVLDGGGIKMRPTGRTWRSSPRCISAHVLLHSQYHLRPTSDPAPMSLPITSQALEQVDGRRIGAGSEVGRGWLREWLYRVGSHEGWKTGSGWGSRWGWRGFWGGEGREVRSSGWVWEPEWSVRYASHRFPGSEGQGGNYRNAAGDAVTAWRGESGR